MTNLAPSLFDEASNSPFSSAADWFTGTLLGSVAISLCVLAVAFVGLLLLSGRLAVRDGLRVVIGCFVLLGASGISAALRDGAYEVAGEPDATMVPETPEPSPRTGSNYDPYAGASMRQD